MEDEWLVPLPAHLVEVCEGAVLGPVGGAEVLGVDEAREEVVNFLGKLVESSR